MADNTMVADSTADDTMADSMADDTLADSTIVIQ